MGLKSALVAVAILHLAGVLASPAWPQAKTNATTRSTAVAPPAPLAPEAPAVQGRSTSNTPVAPPAETVGRPSMKDRLVVLWMLLRSRDHDRRR